MSLLIVGSIAFDSIKTPYAEKENVLGGSASYFSAAASFFTKVNLVGVVGHDFDDDNYAFLKKRGVDMRGLIREPGETFKWKGEYQGDMNEAKTHCTCLNVFEHFAPKLPIEYVESDFVFLGNIHPKLQMEVLNQTKKPKFKALDSMNLWINNTSSDLKNVIKRVDMVILNDKEAKTFTEQRNIFDAAIELQKLGPKVIVIKRGEFGSYLRYKKEEFLIPAYPLRKVVDPTGAGDSFAGGFMGYIAKSKKLDFKNFKKAMLYGTLMASFNIESFGVDGLKNLNMKKINSRFQIFRKLFAI